MKNKFTYGIELEGIFTPSFVESLNKHNLVGECKTDGSVRSERILNSYDLESEYMYKNNGDISCEISSSILNFTELNKFLSITKKFYEKGYYFDNSCGIHIHIKGNDQKMNELVTTEFF